MTPLAKLAAVVLMAEPRSRHGTHGSLEVEPRKVQLQSYHPPSTFETYGDGIDHPLTKRGVVDADSAGVAKAFLESKLGISADAISHRSGSSSDVAQHEYFRQQFGMQNGIPFANAVANVAVKNNKVASYGAGFVKPMTKEEAIVEAEAATDTKYNNWPIALEYFAKDSDHLVLAHVTQVESEDTGERYESYVDASNGDIVNMISFVHQASYRVVPFTSQDPDDCFAVVTNPQDTVASPDSWHQYGSTTTTTTTTTTSGNNAIAYKDSTSATTLQSSASNNYNYVFSPSVALATSPNVNTARVNSFYVANTIHNLTYRYDFDEAPYSFQQNNNGKGALLQTVILAECGCFFFWTLTNPRRNGAFENDVVTHGYGHGISMRLTGGGTARCLTTQQAWGLNEGWSNALADWTEGRIRHQYSRWHTKTTNPLTYASLATLGNEEHAVGEVWALIWHEIYAGLINKYQNSGFSTNKNNPTGTTGNIVALHLFIDSLKIQPCKHTFITARDAIIQADANRYGGANKCTLGQHLLSAASDLVLPKPGETAPPSQVGAV
ncbi:hypothetical protein B0J17DRAFT_634198 [Rhizoctonia solani]|nr:hypothetical protein B0J17DRAFT_634198 [Rhizoctonia solani]